MGVAWIIDRVAPGELDLDACGRETLFDPDGPVQAYPDDRGCPYARGIVPASGERDASSRFPEGTQDSVKIGEFRPSPGFGCARPTGVCVSTGFSLIFMAYGGKST